MVRAIGRRAARALAFCLVTAFAASGCNAKSQVVCDKLDGCGLLSGSAEECVETIRRGFAEEGVDGEKLTLCIDCASIKFCDELRQGLCADSCAEVLEELRQSGVLPARASDAGAE